MDIAFPDKNESGFLKMAERLNIDVKFAYSYKGNFRVENIVISNKGIRKNFERNDIKMLFDLENIPRRDALHQRTSGLNQVLAKIAFEKKKIIGFNFSNILNSDDEKRAILLGRMRQNVKLCRKYKVRMFIGSFASDPYDLRSKYELRSFGVMLGMNPKEIKESFEI